MYIKYRIPSRYPILGYHSRQMTTNKTTISSLVEICARKGVKKVVLSPGSRNSPLAIAFNRHSEIDCYVVVDERAAAFFAMGMAQQTQQAVAICCTSGSAALNYAPAIVEAFYQRIPLLVLTADRPVEWIDQGAGQTIRQRDVYEKYVLKSFELMQEAEGGDDLWYNDRLVNEAINLAHYPKLGPVHVNIPLREPLYGLVEKTTHQPKIQEVLKVEQSLSDAQLNFFLEKWKNADSKLILCGLMSPNEKVNELLGEISEDDSVSVLTETTANVFSEKFNPCIDRLISTIKENEEKDFRPEILVTIGGAIVSKKIKLLLARMQPTEHWHIDAAGIEMDTYQSLTQTIPITPTRFFQQLIDGIGFLEKKEKNFQAIWNERNKLTQTNHLNFLKETKYSDLKAFEIILKNIPSGSIFQMGNSSTIRYVQLFDQRPDLAYFSNRGTSGIDGCNSTAVGAALVSGKPTTLVSGDLSFFYDVNGLWNKYLPSNLRIIIINNSGGGIFRIIPGPSTSDELDEFFEVTQERTAEPFAKMYGLSYHQASSAEELANTLLGFYQDNNQAGILEVFTPRAENDKVLKAWFDNLI